MKNSKKLIIFSSVFVILLAALIGGTWAWFYLNEEVTVNYGNSIFCEAGDSLEIALIENNTASRWSSSIDYSAGEFTTVDISGDGYHLFRPAEINEHQQPVGFNQAVSSLDDANGFDYIEMEVAFRSLSKMDVYLSDESFIEPANPDDKASNIYGNFSRDYIAGAMRVAVIEGDEVKMIWAPNSNYQLIQNADGSYDFKTGINGNSVRETSYSYYVEDENGKVVEKVVPSEDYASKKFVIDSTRANKNFSGNSPSLVSLNPTTEGAYAQKSVKIRIWFEGTDREAHQALAGGNVKMKLKFVGVNKEAAEDTKQAQIDAITYDENTSKFVGLSEGMVFSTDGQNWVTYNPNKPNVPQLEIGESIYFKYPETSTNYETDYFKYSRLD